MIVVDTSAVMAVLAREPSRDAVVVATRGHTLAASRSLVAEVGNGWSALFRRRRTSLSEAREALREFATIPIHFVEIDLEAAVELSSTFGVYAYDAYPILCALKTGYPLLTLDRHQRTTAHRAGASTLDL